MPCGVSATFPVLNVTLTCTNSGANTHAGLHTITASLFGRNFTWAWKAPVSGQNNANTTTLPVAHKTINLGEADF